MAIVPIHSNGLTEHLRKVKELRGSDLHLTVGMPPMMRRDGTLHPLSEVALTADDCRELIEDVLTERQRADLQKNRELDFALHLQEVARFRANAHYIRGTVQAAFRLIADEIPQLTQLGHRPMVSRLCDVREGLVLVTGITGSGKSTTLASMVEQISQRRSGVIISIEDPIEYLFRHGKCIIKQREVGLDTHGFAPALRHALRQDPDVILVSEMRDLETIRTAVTAAETGHLVISTLHTIDAPKTLDRLIDVFPGDQQPQIVAQLSNALKAVVSQRLLPRSNGEGRVLATEIMVMNHAIRTCLRQRKYEQIPGLMQIGAHEGMHTLDDSLADLVLTDQVTLEEALHHARDPQLLASRMTPVTRGPVKRRR